MDVAEVNRGIARRVLLATHTACDGLATDAASALGQLPTPDQRLTDELNTAYLDLARAAQRCSEAGSFKRGAFQAYASLAGAGVAALRRAEARYRLLVPAARRAKPAKATGPTGVSG
jgi:hypothetical protein